MTIGPAPMMRTLLISVRLGMGACLLQQLHETIEQVIDVMRPRAGLGMALETERRAVGEREALERAVKQRIVGYPRVAGQGRRVDGETVVLRSDQDTPVIQILTGWFAPWWPNFIFTVRAPSASAMSWWPRQTPNNGTLASSSSRVASMA